MPSWSDGESSPERLPDFTAMDYAPETCADLSFSGVAVGAERCRVHDLEPIRCVAFEGTNTGRRFHMCCIQDYVENCGFQKWVDAEEWPEALKNSLGRLWSMYHEASDKRIEERLENAKLVQELVEDRDKFKKNYYSLMDDVAKFMKDKEKRVMEENLKKMNDEKEAIFDLDRPALEAEVIKLNSELFDFKEEKKQWESMTKHWESMEKLRKEKWEKKEEAWKEEKKKLEYTLFDLFKVNSANKEKLLQIKGIIGEI